MNPSAAPAPAPAPASGRSRWLPGLQLLRGYPSSWWRHDIAAGLVLTTMLVPVGIAYAVASGVPGIHGLYATIACLLAYALFGPSRILVLGPDSSLAALILAVVLPLSAGSPQRAVALAGAMALAVGLLCIAAGLARLGFVTELLSKPIRYGYMNGIALAVIVSQCPKLFDMKTQGERPPAQLLAFAAGLLDGRANAAAAAIGVAALVLILLLKRWPRLPAMLLAITLATVVVGAFGLDGSAGVAVLGAVPQGLPAPAWPTCCRCSAARWRWHWWPLPTPACCRAPTRSARTRSSMPTRSCSRWARPTSPAGFFKASRSTAVRRARRWPRRPVRVRR